MRLKQTKCCIQTWLTFLVYNILLCPISEPYYLNIWISISSRQPI